MGERLRDKVRFLLRKLLSLSIGTWAYEGTEEDEAARQECDELECTCLRGLPGSPSILEDDVLTCKVGGGYADLPSVERA